MDASASGILASTWRNVGQPSRYAAVLNDDYLGSLDAQKRDNRRITTGYDGVRCSQGYTVDIAGLLDGSPLLTSDHPFRTARLESTKQICRHHRSNQTLRPKAGMPARADDYVVVDRNSKALCRIHDAAGNVDISAAGRRIA